MKSWGTGELATGDQPPVRGFFGAPADQSFLTGPQYVVFFEAPADQSFLTGPRYVGFWGTSGPVISY
jgi:hypothetical protein